MEGHWEVLRHKIAQRKLLMFLWLLIRAQPKIIKLEKNVESRCNEGRTEKWATGILVYMKANTQFLFLFKGHSLILEDGRMFTWQFIYYLRLV